jgi:hypothetical protein
MWCKYLREIKEKHLSVFIVRMSLNRAGFFLRGTYLESGRRFGGVQWSPFELLPSPLRLGGKKNKESPAAGENVATGLATVTSKAEEGGKVRKPRKRKNPAVKIGEENIGSLSGKKKTKKDCDIFDDEELDTD